MPYFTSWDANVFLCLVSLGLPGDLSKYLTKKIKREHNNLELKNARDYHCKRENFVNMEGIEMLYLSRADLSDRDWCYAALSKLESIPLLFHDNLCDMIESYKDELEFLDRI